MPGNFLIDPIDFMNNNLVIPQHENLGQTQGDAGTHTMCLYKMNARASQHGRDIDVYVLMKPNRLLKQDRVIAIFEAYWCPYAKNDTLTVMLGMDSSYMFTATMDGCSFGIGSQTGDGSCRVGHANEATHGATRESTFGMDGARQFQRSEQENRLKFKLGNDVRVISPLHYMADVGDGELVLKSTTFGIRNNMTWEFYTQKYWKNGRDIFLREVVRQ